MGYCPATGVQARVRPEHRVHFDAECRRAVAALPAYPPRPSPRHYVPLGDAIARATSALGVKPCAPCKQRQEALNRLIPKLW